MFEEMSGNSRGPKNPEKPLGTAGSTPDLAGLVFDVNQLQQAFRTRAARAITEAMGERAPLLEDYLGEFLLRLIRQETVMFTHPTVPSQNLTLNMALEIGDNTELFNTKCERAHFVARTGEHVLFLLSFPNALRREARHAGLCGDKRILEKLGEDRFMQASRIIYRHDRVLSDSWKNVGDFFPSCANASFLFWRGLLTSRL